MKRPAPIFKGEARNGRLLFGANHASFLDHVRSLEGPVEVVVRKVRDRRSLEANKYYWGVVLTTFGDSTGYDPEELHQVLKERFLSGGSTSELDAGEFAEYMDKVIQLAAENDCVIPMPDQVDV